MSRSPNAQLAVDLYKDLHARYNWIADTAWHGIALLLLSCEVYKEGWEPFHNVVTYIDSNRFKIKEGRPSSTLRKAEQLTVYLAEQLDLDRATLCENIGLYWRVPSVRGFQPNNLVGHAFRSLILTALQVFGDPGVTYEEEADPHKEFPGQVFTTRSKNPRIDIMARRDNRTVAILTVRWRVRHDRLDVIDEAMAYAPAARRHNPNCKVYPVLGEFDGGRLRKVLANCPPIFRNAALDAAVHFEPLLITEGLQENGTLEYLRSLAWLISETFHWK
ncbi:MAG: hypothetical protein QOG23_1381 [Blastocatellia bacterium]|jgi:hypothetical protein|nr:hypothetical protein [Blastocatellia bacterium]